MAWAASTIREDTSVGGRLQTFQANLQQMERLFALLGSPDNTRGQRQQLTDLREKTRTLAVDLKNQLANDRSPMKEKQLAELQRLTKQFQDLAHRIKQKEQTLLDDVNRNHANTEENPNTMARRRQTMNEYQVHTFQEVDAAIINETNNDMRALEQDMTELVQVMKEVQTITYDQGQKVDKIETQTTQADHNVVKATHELRDGESLANSIRKKKVIIVILIIVCLILIIGGIALGVYFALKK